MTTVADLSPAALEAMRRIEENGTDAERAELRILLRQRGLLPDPAAEYRAGGPMLLGERLMPSTVYGARSPLHDFVNGWHLTEAQRKPGALCAVAAPRGHGKSTSAVELGALWHAANCTRRFIVIVSDTHAQARERVQAIKTAIETNEELRAAYPRLRPAFEAGEPGQWQEADLVLACGCRILGMGAGTSVRGLKHRDMRPDLLILDDFEDEGSVSTPYQIEKRYTWLTRVALALGSPVKGMSVLWVGTILSRDALLNLATGAALDEGQRRPQWAGQWDPHVFRAELDGPKREVHVTVEDAQTGAPYKVTRMVGEPMWSELTREDLAKIAARDSAAYAAEYMADPVDVTGGFLQKPLPASWVNPDAPPQLRAVRCPDGTIVPVSMMTRAAALDPQYSDKESNDPDLAAVVVVGQAGARTFILDSWIGRDRHGQAATLVRMALAWGCFAAAVEVNAAQVVTADQAAAFGSMPILREPSTDGKAERALGLSVRLGPKDRREECRVFIMPDGHNNSLPEYLVRFPNGRYKDPVDATVMAVNVATRVSTGQSGAVPKLGGERRRDLP